MKTKLVLGAVAAAVAVFSQGVFAQSASSPTRAEVKAGAQAKGGTPAGEGPVVNQPSKASDKTRDERKATTKADKASGNLKGAGETGAQKEDKAMKSTGTETTRDARKAKTKAENKSGQIPAAGEGGSSGKKP